MLFPYCFCSYEILKGDFFWFFDKKPISLHQIITSRVAIKPTNRPLKYRWQRW